MVVFSCSLFSFLAFFTSSRVAAFDVCFAPNRLSPYLTPFINPNIWSPIETDFAFI
jgi:hypothetical protein